MLSILSNVLFLSCIFMLNMYNLLSLLHICRHHVRISDSIFDNVLLFNVINRIVHVIVLRLRLIILPLVSREWKNGNYYKYHYYHSSIPY